MRELDIKDLMVGNKFTHQGDDVEIFGIKDALTVILLYDEQWFEARVKDLVPIKLSKQIMDNMGLGVDEEGYPPVYNGFEFFYNNTIGKCSISINDGEYVLLQLEYIHELQNAFKILTKHSTI